MAPTKPKDFLKSSVENATLNIVLQVLFRIVTFILNAFTLRYVKAEVLGVMNVRLLLMESTVLFISRESFRRSCLSDTRHHNWPQVINLMWLTLPLCILCSFLFGAVWLTVLEQPSQSVTQHYTYGVISVGISCCIDVIAEVPYLIAQAFLMVKMRAILDSIYIAVRTLTFAPLVVLFPDKAVLAFCIAQLVSGITFTSLYYIYFWLYIKERNKAELAAKKDDGDNKILLEKENFPFTSVLDFFPRRLPNEPFISPTLAALTWSFFKQGLLKQLLTEGERVVMTVTGVLTFAQQGVYDVVNNLGSLAARFIFRPIEENSYFYFSQVVSREKEKEEVGNKEGMQDAAVVLARLLRGMVLLSLAVVVFGYSYSHLALLLYGGKWLAEGPGPILLRAHCICVVLLGINGVTEAFVFAAMSRYEVDAHSKLMVILSVLFVISSWGFTRLFGEIGFIFANCCNMAARITHSIIFIRGMYKNTSANPLAGLLPTLLTVLAFAVAGTVTILSEIYVYPRSSLGHLLIGGVTFLNVLAICLYEEQDVFHFLHQKWKMLRGEKSS